MRATPDGYVDKADTAEGENTTNPGWRSDRDPFGTERRATHLKFRQLGLAFMRACAPPPKL
jgi:hypothetical protein